MKYISSDTNIWLDFSIIDRLDIPFRQSCTYIMFYETIEHELIYPEGLAERLIQLGLKAVDITDEEYFYADEIAGKYPALSIADRIALSIARCRRIILLTGDKSLRNAAKNENVQVIGTIGLLDTLLQEVSITDDEYKDCIEELLRNNGKGIRLPEEELLRRLI